MLHIVSLVGPLYTVAMFGAESLWGRVGRLARNRKDAASTMIKAVSDIASAAAMVFSPHALQSAGIGPSFLEQSWLGGRLRRRQRTRCWTRARRRLMVAA